MSFTCYVYVSLTLAAGLRWHLYLSHIWSTGQDACATIKTQLQLLLPNVKIFLDVTEMFLSRPSL